MLKAKKNSMYIDVTGVDDMTDRCTLMEEIIRRNCDVDPRIIKSLVFKRNRCGDENHMFSLIIAILIIVLLVKAIGLIGAKTEEVRQRTKRRH